MGKFNDWYSKKLVAGPFPTIEDIIKIEKRFHIIINVSDEFKPDIYNLCLVKNIKYFWFPLNEATDNMGINSIYAALQIIWNAEKNNESVLVHCHAGANRSWTVVESYFYLRTKTYPLRPKRDPIIAEQIESMFTFESEADRLNYRRISNNSRLQNNIEMGHLPAEHKMHSFLKQAEKIFQSKETGGMLDNLKLNTHLQSF